jgi:hypothetical protein
VLNVSSSDFDPIAAPCNHVTGVRFQPITDVGNIHFSDFQDWPRFVGRLAELTRIEPTKACCEGSRGYFPRASRNLAFRSKAFKTGGFT